ncbi:MAG: DUF4392 domain-containing protein [Gemmataceae bacterium]|nr:DUF4392 domain-containing protein [Gemmataceae bacterium]
MNAALQRIREVIQRDLGRRGLATQPDRNLINACPDDFALACHSLAATPQAGLVVVTGFFIPTGNPPAGETDGPLGAVYLARALVPLGVRVVLVSDGWCETALCAGLAACGLAEQVAVIALPPVSTASAMTPEAYRHEVWRRLPFAPTHLLAIERVGPSHTLHSLQAQMQSGGALGEAYLDFLDAVPQDHQDRCHSMRGRDVTEFTSPAHHLFEWAATQPGIATIGIGDGGNEIGMGKIPWDVIHRNITNGGLVACRIATRYLIVCGISNWGAYGLAAGVWHLRGRPLHPLLADPENERKILQIMVDHGPLVDGVTGQRAATVDGFAFDDYIAALRLIAAA